MTEKIDLEMIERYDDSIWLYILKETTVFDTELIKAQKDWLIKEVKDLNKKIDKFNEDIQIVTKQRDQLGQSNIEYQKAIETLTSERGKG